MIWVLTRIADTQRRSEGECQDILRHTSRTPERTIQHTVLKAVRWHCLHNGSMSGLVTENGEAQRSVSQLTTVGINRSSSANPNSANVQDQLVKVQSKNGLSDNQNQ